MHWISQQLEKFCADRPARLIDTDGRPYMYRTFVCRLLGLNIYLHHFVSADAERWVHDHPFNGLAIVLTGNYCEERLVSLSWPRMVTERRTVSWFNWISGHCFHRILKPRANTWTLFLHFGKYKGWGFLEEDPVTGQIIYRNPYGNIGSRTWWETAPSYRQLRLLHGGGE